VIATKSKFNVHMYAKNKINSYDKAYGRGCAKTCNKNDVPNYEPGGNADCEVDWYYTDYCNAGSSLSNGVFFMLSCAAVVMTAVF